MPEEGYRSIEEKRELIRDNITRHHQDISTQKANTIAMDFLVHYPHIEIHKDFVENDDLLLEIEENMKSVKNIPFKDFEDNVFFSVKSQKTFRDTKWKGKSVRDMSDQEISKAERADMTTEGYLQYSDEGENGNEPEKNKNQWAWVADMVSKIVHNQVRHTKEQRNDFNNIPADFPQMPIKDNDFGKKILDFYNDTKEMKRLIERISNRIKNGE